MYWNFQTIEYFLKVAETLNFSRAARELLVSTQALNRQIILLEKQLGTRLLTRTTRAVCLTPAGKLVYDEFAPVKRAYDTAVERIGLHLDREGNAIRIGFFDALPKTEVISQIANYLLRHNSAGVKLEALGMDEAVRQMLDGKTDICVLNRISDDVWEGTGMIILARMPAQIVVSLNHPWVVRERITEEDLQSEPVLLMEATTAETPYKYYRGLTSARRSYVPDFTTLLAELDLAQHYAVFPRMFENSKFSRLRFLDLPDRLQFMFEMTCVYKTNSRFAPLFDSMKEYFENMPLELNF